MNIGNPSIAGHPDFDRIRLPDFRSKPQHDPRPIRSLEELSRHTGYIVRYTNDNGNSWQYFHLNEKVFAVDNTDIKLRGIRAHPETKFWEGRAISASVVLNCDQMEKKGCYFQTVLFEEIQDCKFPSLPGGPSRWHASNCPNRPDIDRENDDDSRERGDVHVLAPLTMVRSEKADEQLEISVAYIAPFFYPQQPIFPEPTEIQEHDFGVDKDNNAHGLKLYSWKVITHEDGSITTTDANNITKRVKMLWWEAKRNESATPVNRTEAVCVPRSEIKSFLTASLLKAGVKEKELTALVEFWHQSLQATYNPETSPYVLIEMVKPEDLLRFVPFLAAFGSGQRLWDIERFYFRFEPVADATSGKSAQLFLEQMPQGELPANVVIDLGGEVVNTDKVAEEKAVQFFDKFNQQFIQDHIVVKV